MFLKSKTDVNTQDIKPTGFLKMAFEDLNQDFRLPDTFKKIKKLGAGAYGKVMQVVHIPSK